MSWNDRESIRDTPPEKKFFKYPATFKNFTKNIFIKVSNFLPKLVWMAKSALT